MLGTFVLPFLFPLKVPVFSPVYTAGGNNRAGAILAACMGVVTCLLCWRLRYFQQPLDSAQTKEKLPLRWLWVGTAAVTLSAAVLGLLMLRLHMYYADAGYFLTQLRSGLVFHQPLYRGVEFAYGPLLYLWPAAFLKVLGLAGVSAMAAYVVSLCVMEVVGTAMLFYTVRAMPMRRGMQLAVFSLLCVVTLDPQEGLNYTAFRFVCSVFALILLSRQRTGARAALVAAVGALATFAISPEMGVAFAAGAGVYGLFRTWKSFAANQADYTWLLVPAAAAVGSGVFALLVGPDYFRTLKDFANGGYNMLLEPAPHIYLLLLCVVGLAPLTVSAALADDDVRPAVLSCNGLLIATYIAGLALLPAALGRCDPLHVAFNGWPVFLLSFVALDRMRLPARRIGVALGLLFATYSVAQEYALGSGAVRKLVLQRPDAYENVDLPRLQQVLGNQRVATPWWIPLRASDALTAAGQYQPLYLCIPAVDAHAEERTVREIRQADFVLAPTWYPLAAQNAINNDGMKFHMRLNYRYKQRRAPYLQGLLLQNELRKNWQRVGTFGSYDLYRKAR